MKDNYLDDLVKNALDKLEVPTPSDAWMRFEQSVPAEESLPVEDVADTDFDASVKTALESSQIPHLPMDWAAMETMLNADTILNHGEVDASFQESLHNLEVPYTPAAWDLMEAQLDLMDNMEELADADPVDHIVYEKINNLEQPYHPASWHRLSYQLDQLPAYRHRLIYRYKMAETAMMLLLFFTGFNFIALSPSHTTEDAKPTNPIAELVIETTDSSSTNSEKISIETSKSERSNTGFAKTEPRPTTSNKISQRPSPIDKEVLPVDKVNPKDKSRPTTEDEVPSLADFDHVTKLDHRNITLNPSSIPLNNNWIKTLGETWNTNRLGETSQYDAQTNGLAISSTYQVSDIKRLPAHPLQPLAKKGVKQFPGCLVCNLPKAIGIRASMFVVGDYNYIMTPDDRLFQIEAYNNGSVGYGLGTTFGLTYGKLELETGTIFSNKVYRPENLVETLGDFESGYIRYRLDEIQLNVLQVPLHIRYNFDGMQNWNFYMIGGASMHVVTHALHDFDSSYSGVPSAKRSNHGLRELIEENSTFNYKNLSPGWFQSGGSFLENSYFTANFGLGLERSIGTRWSVFTQSTYQHSLFVNGFGPNKDRLNIVSVFAGARARIGSKFKKQAAY